MSSNIQLLIEPFVFDAPASPDTPPLKFTAKRYTHAGSSENTRGLTLLLTHCIGAHKEQWEPALVKMFALQPSDKDAAHRIREAWSFDWQTHGDAGVLNRGVLKDRSEVVSVYEWAAALASFVSSPRMQNHRIVAIGHSAGAGAMTLSTKYLSQGAQAYTTLVLVESAIVTRALFNDTFEDRMLQMNYVVKATLARTDAWKSRAEAHRWLGKRYPWNTWDERVVRIYADHGLHEEQAGGVVTLKCDKKQEAASYPDVDGHFESAEILARICRELPVHLVWGAVDDIIPEDIKDSLGDAAEGRAVASVRRVEDAGHMVVQEQPDRLAEALCAILDGIQSSERSKL